MKQKQGQRSFRIVLHDLDIVKAGDLWEAYMKTPVPPGYPAHHKDAPSHWDRLKLLELTGDVSGNSMEAMDMIDTGWLRNTYVQLRKKDLMNKKPPGEQQQEMDLR